MLEIVVGLHNGFARFNFKKRDLCCLCFHNGIGLLFSNRVGVIMWNFTFFLNSILLGLGLTMDAFSVSIADGLNEPDMRKRKMLSIAGCFAFFQFAMPMIGWICVHTIVEKFSSFRYAIPWVALLLLGYIGGSMIYDNLKKNKEEAQSEVKVLRFWPLIVQGIATSIDALSVGFTIAEYTWEFALVASIIIAVVTISFCLVGLFFGRKVGTKFTKRAELFGGLILIGIGLEIFISNMIELYA